MELVHPEIYASNIATVSSSTFDYVDGEILFTGSDYIYYFVKAVVDGSETSKTNTVDARGGFYKRAVNNNDNVVLKNKLFYNYPNPFNPSTKINYSLPENSFVEIKVFNIYGEQIKTLVNEYKTAGEYSVDFNGKDLASGVYLYSIKTNNYSAVKKMILQK